MRIGLTVVTVLLIAAIAACAATADAAKRKNAYLTPEGQLAHALVLKDAQGGFAGFSGHIWTIEPDGSWRREPFLNRNAREADRKGTLTKQQLVALGKHLTTQDLMGLPGQIGKNIGANPHVFTITFGEKQSSLTVNPGAPLPKGDPNGAEPNPQARFAAIARFLLGGLKARAAEE